MADVPALVDHLERPLRRRVSKADLEKAIATASLTGVRQAWSPLQITAGLTPERLGAIMRAAAQGDHQEYVILAEEMEERDWHYAAALSQRKLAVLGVDRTVIAASGDEVDQVIAQAVREHIVEDEAFEDLLASSLDAMGKGWAATEIGWDTKAMPWAPTAYDWRDPRFFVWDIETGRELRLLDEADMVFGVPLAPNRFAVHKPQLKMGLPVRGGLARLAAWAFLFKFYTVKDWAAFSETYGQPLRVGKYDPAATKEDMEVLYQAVAMIGTDCAAVIPQAMQIEFINASQGSSQSGADLYQKFADFLDRQVSKAVLGQTGTTDMQHGGGLAQAKVLDGVRGDLTTSDCKQLARTVRRDVIEPFVRFNFGPVAKIPGLLLQTTPPEDLEKFTAGVTQFIDRGLKVSANQVREKFGLKTPEGDEEVLGPAAGKDSALKLPGPDATAGNRRVFGYCPLHGDPAVNRQGASAGGDAYTDLIGSLADPLNEGWEPAIAALVEPIAHLAQRATSYDEFAAELDQVIPQMDATKLARGLALAMVKARGVGDATDKPGAS